MHQLLQLRMLLASCAASDSQHACHAGIAEAFPSLPGQPSPWLPKTIIFISTVLERPFNHTRIAIASHRLVDDCARIGPNAVSNMSTPDFMYGAAWKEDRTRGAHGTRATERFSRHRDSQQRRHYFEAGVGQGLSAPIAMARDAARCFSANQIHLPDGQDHRLPYDPGASFSVKWNNH